MKWKHSVSVFLVVLFLLLQSTFLYGLSEEEKKILPELSKETLIEIILTQDQGLKSSEVSMKKLQDLIQKLKIQQEADSNQLKIQTGLYQTSLRLQKEKDKEVLKDKIIVGVVSFLSGNLTGGFTGFKIGLSF